MKLIFFQPFSNSRKPGIGLNLPTAIFRAYFWVWNEVRIVKPLFEFQFQQFLTNLPSNSFLYKIQVKMALKLKMSRKNVHLLFLISSYNVLRFHLLYILSKCMKNFALLKNFVQKATNFFPKLLCLLSQLGCNCKASNF